MLVEGIEGRYKGVSLKYAIGEENESRWAIEVKQPRNQITYSPSVSQN